MPHFNDTWREKELREICATCKQRLGKHNMLNKCPTTTANGRIVPLGFEDTQFQGTKHYEQTEVA